MGLRTLYSSSKQTDLSLKVSRWHRSHAQYSHEELGDMESAPLRARGCYFMPHSKRFSLFTQELLISFYMRPHLSGAPVQQTSVQCAVSAGKEETNKKVSFEHMRHQLRFELTCETP